MADNSNIFKTVLAQLPLIIMVMNNGASWMTILPIIILPILMAIIENIEPCWKWLWKEKIPNTYVTFCASYNRNNFPSTDIINDLSQFLNTFFQSSIKIGNVEKYQTAPYNPIRVFNPMIPIIDPGADYFQKISFSSKIGNQTIYSIIKKSGFEFPAGMNVNDLLSNPIYISFDTVTEQNQTPAGQTNIKKTVAKISAINIDIAKHFMYIVINYNLHKTNHIDGFKLSRKLYYSDYEASHKYGLISTIVNVKKNYQNVFLSKINEEIVLNNIEKWTKHKSERHDKGMSNKISFLLHGLPGSGKTSLIYAIANETKKSIVSINLQDFSNKTFFKIVSATENNIVVFDDIDSYSFTHQRSNSDQMANQTTNTNANTNANANISAELAGCLEMISTKEEKSVSMYHKAMTLDSLLEVLDGYNYLNNCIIIITSNRPEVLDSALIRPGRIDYRIEFGLADEYQFGLMFKYFVGIDYKKIDPKFIFKENTYGMSYLINSIILPNVETPQMILDLLR